MKQRILLVDDDALMRRSLSFTLQQAGYEVDSAASAEAGLTYLQHSTPDLILLDISLPGMDGLQALREMQALGSFPVIFLTARRRELDEIVGLELGADDYVTKPFDSDVLLARIRAALRRNQVPHVAPPADRPLEIGDLLIDPAGYTVHLANEPIKLAAREFSLLLALAAEAERVVMVEDLLTRVWGAEYVGEPQVVYVHIRWLREKLERNPSKPERIVTVRGVGYKLMPVEQS